MGEAFPAAPKSIFGNKLVPQAPVDPLYSLLSACEADPCPQKVDLSVGAYRDDNARPWLLPSVKRATQIYGEDPVLNHEYLPIEGLIDFTNATQRLILGTESTVVKNGRICTFQAISGTGALHLGGALLSKFIPEPKPDVYISNPSWPIHRQCFENDDFTVQEYPYFDPATRGLNFDGMMSVLSSAPTGSIIVLHACAHNPTGVDPAEEQWRTIAQVMDERGLFPFFDCAYQGFATGSLAQDSAAIRLFVDMGFEMVIAQSFAKNMGLYGQRVGAFHYVASPGNLAQEQVKRVASQMAIIQRSEISSPPSFGAKLASIILNDPQLFSQWEQDLQTMSSRIIEMRHSLKSELERLGTPGTWNHLVDQIGMFSFTGLNECQVDELKSKWHVYMLFNGRISVAGLNKNNVSYFAGAIHDVVTRLG